MRKRNDVDRTARFLGLLSILILLLPAHRVMGQISQGGTPIGYSLKSTTELIFLDMPYVDNQSMMARDSHSRYKSGPYRFGVKSSVDLGLDNSGQWRKLENGDRIWNLAIRSAGAFSLNLFFAEYELPYGARLFIYNQGRSDFLGAFDYRNNKSHGSLATSLIRGEAIVVEYFEPASVKGMGRLRVGSVTHAYRDVYRHAKSLIPGFGAADPCTINVHCPQGDEWQEQSRSVVMLMVNGSGFCSATLLNNTRRDGTPYVLTADHCLGSDDGSDYVALFNYESPVCKNSYPKIDQSVSGMVIRARSRVSDFALLEMSVPPPASYNALYSGWSRSGTLPSRCIGIGHPSGDIKKWNEEIPRGKEPGYWWTSPKLNSGQTENGSSGSGAWDENGRLVGQLYGGSGWCDDVDLINYWGRFDRSWDGGGTDSTRLKNWLDAANTDSLYIDHYEPNTSSHPEITFQVNMSEADDLDEEGAVRLHLKHLPTAIEMQDTQGIGLYSVRQNFSPWNEVKYHFSYQNGPDPASDVVDEREGLLGGECADAEARRTLIVEARHQVLPAVMFASCLVNPELPRITLQVDLSDVEDMYEGGKAWVSFGNWDTWWVMTDDDGDGVFSATGLQEPGGSIGYFFSYQDGPDENADYSDERPELRGLECANPEGFRLLTVPEEDLVLPAIIYGTCEETGSTGVTAPRRVTGRRSP